MVRKGKPHGPNGNIAEALSVLVTDLSKTFWPGIRLVKSLYYWYRTTENKNDLRCSFEIDTSLLLCSLNPTQYFLCISQNVAVRSQQLYCFWTRNWKVLGFCTHLRIWFQLIPLDLCYCLNRTKGFDHLNYEKYKNVLIIHIPLLLAINCK